MLSSWDVQDYLRVEHSARREEAAQAVVLFYNAFYYESAPTAALLVRAGKLILIELDIRPTRVFDVYKQLGVAVITLHRDIRGAVLGDVIARLNGVFKRVCEDTR